MTREEHRFSTDEIDFLSTLAGQAAMSIHHAQLYDRSQQQADEFRHAHKIKDGFVKSVSSELKTPLNVITGYTDMFREGLLGELTPIQEKAIETVARQANELQGLISSVLLVTNLEAEPIHAEQHDLNLWEFLAELRRAYDQPRAKNVNLIWDYPADLPTVQGDRSKLKHILRNLIDNALKFTDVGTVTITVRYLAAKKLLEFKIADSGVGIPAAQVAAIFERFRQVESADAGAARGGFGLGLYVVKKFLDGLGGTIDVESHPGAGSTFTLQIPAPSQNISAIDEQLQISSRSEFVEPSSR
jgi:signal transduction histidine kinase